MEKIENKYIIMYENGRIVEVLADNLENAIEQFKELKLDTESKEIRVLSAYEMYNQHNKI
jgi:hypothetical protein